MVANARVTKFPKLVLNGAGMVTGSRYLALDSLYFVWFRLVAGHEVFATHFPLECHEAWQCLIVVSCISLDYEAHRLGFVDFQLRFDPEAT